MKNINTISAHIQCIQADITLNFSAPEYAQVIFLLSEISEQFIALILSEVDEDFNRSENYFLADSFVINARYHCATREADLQDLSDIFLTLREFFSPEAACFSTDYGKKYADELMTMKKDFYSKISAEMREKTADFWFSDVTLILTYQKKGNFSLQIDPDFYQKIFPNVRICLSVYE